MANDNRHNENTSRPNGNVGEAQSAEAGVPFEERSSSSSGGNIVGNAEPENTVNSKTANDSLVNERANKKMVSCEQKS